MAISAHDHSGNGSEVGSIMVGVVLLGAKLGVCEPLGSEEAEVMDDWSHVNARDIHDKVYEQKGLSQREFPLRRDARSIGGLKDYLQSLEIRELVQLISTLCGRRIHCIA